MQVRLENITKQFDQVTAVDHFSITLQEGNLYCLLGPSGCGKSTILNMLSGILPVTEGKIYFDEKDVTEMTPDKRGIGLVFQNYALYPHMSVLENICFPLEIQKVNKQERKEKAIEMAKLVHIEEYLNRLPKELSGGQQQRVAIARALIKKPQLLLLDEPLSNLDARLRIEMREEIRRIQQETKVTTIFVTHDQEEAMSISDKIVLMKKGVLQQFDNPQVLYDQPANQFVADFLGTPPINHLYGHIHDGAFELEDGSISLKFADLSGFEEGRKVTLSIRAEALTVKDDDAFFEATLIHSYTMGKEELGNVRIGTSEIRAYISSDHELKDGAAFPAGLRKKGVFLFDTQTGERLI